MTIWIFCGGGSRTSVSDELPCEAEPADAAAGLFILFAAMADLKIERISYPNKHTKTLR